METSVKILIKGGDNMEKEKKIEKASMTILIPKDLRLKVGIYRLNNDMGLSELVIEALEDYMQKKERE